MVRDPLRAALLLACCLSACATARDHDRSAAHPRVRSLAIEQLGCDAVSIAWMAPGEPIRPSLSPSECAGDCDPTNPAALVPDSSTNYARASGCGDTELVIECDPVPATPRCATVTQCMTLAR